MEKPSSEDARLELLYRFIPWQEDPFTPEGRARYEFALKFFRELVRHKWFEDLVVRKELRVLDVCGGTGIGGVALAKALSEKGVKVRLTVLDLRESALKLAEKFSAEELGEASKTRKIDARAVRTLGERFDVVLLYGLSTPHFDAFSLVQLIASVASSLELDGVFLMEETDRFYSLTLLATYKHIFYEGDERKGVVSFHIDYDPLRGVEKRLFLNPFTGERAVAEMRHWDLPTTLALAWIFFEELDFASYLGARATGIILARRPRGKLKPEDLKLPEFAKKP
jgi:hypothetical protein